MDLTKVETIAAGGALIISAGSFWYLNSKLEEGVIKLDVIQKNFLTQIAKMSQHDDDIKIMGSKIKDFEELLQDINKLKTDFSGMSEELSDEFNKIKTDITKQDKKIKQLNDKIDMICQNLGIDHKIIDNKGSLNVQKSKQKISLKNKTNKNYEIPNKKVKDISTKEENLGIFSEMDAILNS